MPIPPLIQFEPNGTRRIRHIEEDRNIGGGFMRLEGGDDTGSPDPYLEPLEVNGGTDISFEVQKSPEFNEVTGASEALVGDRYVFESLETPEFTDWFLTPIPEDGFLTLEPYLYKSLSTNTAVVDSDGLVTGLQSGEAVIEVSNSGLVNTQRFSLKPPDIIQTPKFIRHAENSTAKELTDAIISRLIGKNRDQARPTFSVRNNAGSVYVRNPNCWLSDINLAPMSVYNSQSQAGGNVWRVTAVSPIHAIGAAHAYYLPRVGNTIRWVTMDNQVIERVVVEARHPPEYLNDEQPNGLMYLTHPDFGLITLDQPLPASIGFARVLPDNVEDYLPNIWGGGDAVSATYLPCFVTNIHLDAMPRGQLTFYDYINLDDGREPAPRFINHNSGQTWEYKHFFELDFNGGWFKGLVGGDSGNFTGFIHQGQLVLTSVHTTSSTGTNIQNYKSLINGWMALDSGGYSLTDADFSANNTY